ncbi:MAG: T9SS type A sorting domain-containing protein, partial [Cyclobacteriaceae bacterium]
NNFLAFDDLSPNIGISDIIYSPQGTLLEKVEELYNEGESVTIDRVVGGSGNVYSWTKDSAPIIGGADGTLEIPSVGFSDEGVYSVSVTNSSVPELTITTATFELVVSSLAKDIEALVAVYEATGGENWNNNDNWIDGDISTWEGVGLSGNRVTSLVLSDNNLTGTLPDDILDILNLTTLNLSDNELDSIPSLTSLDNLTTLNVGGNFLQFDDLEANVGIENFSYSNQRIRGETETLSITRGDQVTLSEEIAGSVNNYQWALNGSAIVGANQSEYLIDDIGFDDIGNYSLTVTNGLLPLLSLETPVDSVLAITTISGTVTGQGGVQENGEVVVLRVVGNNEPYVPIDSITFSNGTYVFENLTLADYIVIINPESTVYIPTYHRSGFLWNEADTLFLRENGQTADVSLVADPENTNGQAAIGGVFEEEFDEEVREEARRRVRRVGVALRRRRSSGRTDEDEFELIAYTQTDDDGRFSFPNLPAGIYRINFEFPGIPMDETSFVEFEILEGEEPSNLELEAVATEEGKIVVTDVTPEPVSVADLDLPFEVYPNPAKDHVIVDFRKIPSASLRITLLDYSGRTITEITPDKGVNNETIDLSTYDEGIYLIRLTDDKKQTVFGTYRILKN